METRFRAYQEMTERWLCDYMDGVWPYGKLSDAMGYSLLAGGKRIRPALTLAACRFCGGEEELALPFACALEMVHTYSLIHDDLPCMDDDDFRRGKPSSHKVFGEATAILAGDALLTSAFSVLAQAPGLSEGQRLQAVACLAEAAGPDGMIAGQILDMAAAGVGMTQEQITRIEALKTGRMIVAAVRLGAIAAGGSPERETALCRYAEALGLAFQVQDDILDVSGDESELGKPIGSDREMGKATFVSLLGLNACREMVARLTAEAVEALSSYEERAFLCDLARFLGARRA